MTAPFSESEKIAIQHALKEAAKECLQKYGIKKTTVDELTQKAGISKGAFYRFYPSKELLFFDILSDMHSEFYAVARKVLKERTDLPLKERIEKALLDTLMYILHADFLQHIEKEFSYLTRKIPEKIQKEHSLSGDLEVKSIIEEFQLPVSSSDEVIFAFMRTFETLIIHQDTIGKKHLENILKILVKSLCDQIIPS